MHDAGDELRAINFRPIVSPLIYSGYKSEMLDMLPFPPIRHAP
jgi:hypothetical protein